MSRGKKTYFCCITGAYIIIWTQISGQNFEGLLPRISCLTPAFLYRRGYLFSIKRNCTSSKSEEEEIHITVPGLSKIKASYSLCEYVTKHRKILRSLKSVDSLFCTLFLDHLVKNIYLKVLVQLVSISTVALKASKGTGKFVAIHSHVYGYRTQI